MEAPPHPMRLGDSEQDYYRLGPSFAAGQPVDLLSMLARSHGESPGAGSAGAGEAGSAGEAGRAAGAPADGAGGA